jgi:hypothetical protein
MSQATSVAPLVVRPASRSSSGVRLRRLAGRALLYVVVIAFALFMS